MQQQILDHISQPLPNATVVFVGVRDIHGTVQNEDKPVCMSTVETQAQGKAQHLKHLMWTCVFREELQDEDEPVCMYMCVMHVGCACYICAQVGVAG